jgi:flagellin-like hook-associated protein FlgL
MNMRLNYIDNIDCLEGLAQVPDNSVGMVLTDPPYSSGGAFAGDRRSRTGTKYTATDYEGAAALPDFSGANMDQRMEVYIGTMTAVALGVRELGDETIISLASPAEANRAIGTIDEALKKINKQRADLGGYQNRLEHAVKGIDIAAENLQAAESRIRDTDMAAQMVEFTKNQVLAQAGTAMLAQANTQSQNVMTLLR